MAQLDNMYPTTAEEALELCSRLKADFGLVGWGYAHREDWDEAFGVELTDEQYARLRGIKVRNDPFAESGNETLDFVAQELREQVLGT